MSSEFVDTLWMAAALMLVIEGVLPFLNPGGFRRAMGQLAELTDSQLRWAGLTSMLIGLLILHWVN